MNLKYQGKYERWKFYALVYQEYKVGHLECFINHNCIHIRTVFIEPSYRKELSFWKWLAQFDTVYAYEVLPEAEAYWLRQGAQVASKAKDVPFMDIIFGEEDFNETW
jgi:hypothetical protein